MLESMTKWHEGDGGRERQGEREASELQACSHSNDQQQMVRHGKLRSWAVLGALGQFDSTPFKNTEIC